MEIRENAGEARVFLLEAEAGAGDVTGNAQAGIGEQAADGRPVAEHGVDLVFLDPLTEQFTDLGKTGLVGEE